MENSSFERLQHEFVLYEKEISDLRIGSYLTRFCDEHVVSVQNCRGLTTFNHYYNSRIGIKLLPSRPELQEEKKKDDFDPRNLDPNYRMSISEAEALVAQFPNKAKAWTYAAVSYFRYKSLHKAKLFLRRGIDTIDSREHEEKLNLWKVLIMIEAEHGSREELLAVFDEALKHNNKKILCLETLRCLFEINKTKAFEVIKDKMLQKFKSQKDVYLVLSEYYMKKGAKKEVKDLFERGWKNVPPKDHPDLLRKFGILRRKYRA